MSASIGNMLMLTNIIDLGADIKFEGCPSGPAIIAACVAGQKECVKYLVRHGAKLIYNGPRGFRSAYAASATTPEILDWLLVQCFVNQKKLPLSPCDLLISREYHESFTWGGPVKMELVISGMMQRLPNESSKDYWS